MLSPFEGAQRSATRLLAYLQAMAVNVQCQASGTGATAPTIQQLAGFDYSRADRARQEAHHLLSVLVAHGVTEQAGTGGRQKLFRLISPVPGAHASDENLLLAVYLAALLEGGLACGAPLNAILDRLGLPHNDPRVNALLAELVEWDVCTFGDNTVRLHRLNGRQLVDDAMLEVAEYVLRNPGACIAQVARACEMELPTINGEYRGYDGWLPVKEAVDLGLIREERRGNRIALFAA